MTVIAGPLYSQGYDVYERNTQTGCPYWTFSVYQHGVNENTGLPVYNACPNASGFYKGLPWGQAVADLIVNEYIASITTCTAPGITLSIPSCSSSIVQNTTQSVTLTPSGGTPPYRYDFIVDNVIKSTWTGMTGSQTFNFNFNQSVGNHTYQAKITDSCTNPGPQTNTSSCTISVTSNVLTYQCINNLCQQSICTVGTANCYTSNNCNLACTAPPPITGCPTGQTGLLGTCVKTSYLLIGGAAFMALILLKRK